MSKKRNHLRPERCSARDWARACDLTRLELFEAYAARVESNLGAQADHIVKQVEQTLRHVLTFEDLLSRYTMLLTKPQDTAVDIPCPDTWHPDDWNVLNRMSVDGLVSCLFHLVYGEDEVSSEQYTDLIAELRKEHSGPLGTLWQADDGRLFPAPYSRFGAFLARSRAAAAQTLEAAAQAAGCSFYEYHRIEVGERLPTLAELARLHRLLGFRADTALNRIARRVVLSP